VIAGLAPEGASILRRVARACGAWLIGSCLAFVVVEGASSGLLLLNDLAGLERVSERRHTRYDAELGWVNLPNVSIDGLYGPGTSFRTNSQAFRNDLDFPVSVPEGKLRIVCSGDSFTLGYGVSNADAWCSRLSALDPSFEAVNMGQGGYGIDQAFLWYRRDGVRLEHQVQLFAFNIEDFRRMQSDSFEGYGKPVLLLDGGRLVVDNVPVPRRAFYAPLWIDALPVIQQLRSYQLLRGLLGGLSPRREPTRRYGATRQVVAAVFESLRDLHQAAGSALVLVYLPMHSDWRSSADLRRLARQEAARLGVWFFDLSEDFRGLPAEELEGLFISDPELRGYGHYSRAGNDFVARQLYSRLTELPVASGRASGSSRIR